MGLDPEGIQVAVDIRVGEHTVDLGYGYSQVVVVGVQAAENIPDCVERILEFHIEQILAPAGGGVLDQDMGILDAEQILDLKVPPGAHDSLVHHIQAE